MSTKTLRIENNGTRRVVLGPGPKSKGGDRTLIKFDTPADDGVDPKRRIGRVRTVDGERAEAIRSSRVVKSLADKLGLQLG